MSNDPSARRILPQNSQMSTFTFAPQQYPQQRETQKNYVFVDEHNRHKRLKVMRACEGCRRRKIKCDAATTNTWPCSACIKLKLHCVRPNGYDGSTNETTTYEPTSTSDFSNTETLQDGFSQQRMLSSASAPKIGGIYQQPGFSQSDTNLYQAVQYADTSPAHNMNYTTVPPPVTVVDDSYATGHVFPTPPLHSGSRQDNSPGAFSQDSYSQPDLADLLGSLKVNEAGTAPYLRNKASFRREEEPAAIDDADDFEIMKFTSMRGKIRIPPALMPDEETALHYFDLYFTQVHPYVPVLSKVLFFQQWNTNRDAMSPLVLEAIFAIGGRLADEPGQGQQWLALASSHADAFMDIPRLSTLQALLILMKARESAPKRGYYYRSWMAIVQCVQMGKDLGLDEHYGDHQSGKGCDSSPIECQMKTRIWQTIFVLELMIGSPQGRTDLQVDIDEVDFSIPRPMPGGDDSEYLVSRNFTYFARLVRSVSRMNSIYSRIRKRKEWGIDPEFVQLNPSLNAWLTELPGDLSVTFPPDNSPPWLPSPFIGNLHSYHYLTFILLHRPQLAFCDPNGMDGKWKQHMMICYSSAKALCRLQEAILKTFGLNGLSCMQRGFSFPVYCGLSCIVLHLVAMTSPDPDLNTDSREYFTRHMRILEKVMQTWPMPELQKQVDAVREAFSADTRKPFVLKPSFPYGSPASSAATPPRSSPGYRPMMDHPGSMGSHGDSTALVTQLSFSSQPMTPPISAGPADGKNASPMMMFSSGPNVSMPEALPISDAPAWNPSRIFEQWNTSFGTPQVQSSNPNPNPTQAATALNVSSSGPQDIQSLEDLSAVNDPLSTGAQQLPTQQYTTPVPAFITPAMWQESVASVYEAGGGLKRAWDYDGRPVKRR